MPKIEMRIRALIEIVIDPFGEWIIPDDYRLAIKSHIGSSPTSMYLPWPVEAVPNNGDALMFTSLAFAVSDWVVTMRKYFYSKEGGLTVYIETEKNGAEHSERALEIGDILALAEEGFLLEDQTSITKVLETAGLPTTNDAFETQRGQ